MRPRQMFRIVVAILVLFLLLSWCAADREAAFLVLFGRDIGETDFVTDEDWADFERTVLAPELGGYTVLEGRGGYLPENEDGEARSAGDQEQTIILLYVTDDSDEAREAIDDVAEQYKERFSQQSVLVLKTDAQLLSGYDGNADADGGILVRIIVLLLFIGLIAALVMRRRSWDMWQ